MAKKQTTVKPGGKTPKSGQYKVIGPRGGDVNKEVTLVKGKPAPPTEKPGQTYVLVDPTDNKSGKG